jgi:hypothetical protein
VAEHSLRRSLTIHAGQTHANEIFKHKQDHCVKVVLHPAYR